MIVAYLILAHRNPRQLAVLVAALPSTSPVLIHFDRRADGNAYQQAVQLLEGRPQLRFVRRHDCRWGAFGIVQATVGLIDELLASGMAFDYASLISGSDYPIKSNREIASFLRRHWGQEFIESFSLLQPNRWSTHGGYFKAPEKALCRHLRFRSRVLRLPWRRRMPLGLQPYGGSQWWTLSRQAIHYISEFCRRAPEFLSFSRHAFIPDEMVIQTILSNSRFAERVRGDDLRLTIWDRPSPPYPAVLTSADLELLLSSEKLYARKFDVQTDPRVLQALADRNSRLEWAAPQLNAASR